MKNKQISYLAFGLLAAAVPAAKAAGVLADPGFEAAGPLVDDGNGVGKWNPFTSGAPIFSLSTTNVNSGAQSLQLSLEGAANSFVGAFQDVTVFGGEAITYAGFHAAVNNDPTAVEIRIEWQGVDVGGAQVEVGRTANLNLSPGTSFEAFSLSAIAPANADTARVVYVAQSFGGNANAVINVDDISVTGVPEPSSSLLAALGFLGLAARRRR